MSTQQPREIAFEDIKKGDDIEARYTRDGVAITRRGVAHSTNPRLRAEHWYAEAGGIVANNYDGDWKHFLHARPVPAEPKGLGAVVRAAIYGRRRVFVRAYPEGEPSPWRAPRDGWEWNSFDPDSIEVLSEGIEVES